MACTELLVNRRCLRPPELNIPRLGFRSGGSPLTSDGFVAKRVEKIAKEVESIIVSQHFSSFDQEVPTHKHQPHHFHEFMLLTRIVGARFDKSDRSCQHDEQATDSFM
ncbi:hypothetical protein Bca4012_030716 [Brassica carinata]